MAIVSVIVKKFGLCPTEISEIAFGMYAKCSNDKIG
jgi:hypothetical protein